MPRRGHFTGAVTRSILLSRIKSTNMIKSSWIRLLPITFFMSYLTFTVFLFAFGPWPWPVMNGTKLYIFLAFANLALLLGYLRGIASTPRDYRGTWSISSILRISLVVSLLLLGPTAMARTGSSIPDIFGGSHRSGCSVYIGGREERGVIL